MVVENLGHEDQLQVVAVGMGGVDIDYYSAEVVATAPQPAGRRGVAGGGDGEG